MTAEDNSNLPQRLDDVIAEVRRQGRAAVAAQATAESCLEILEQLAARPAATTSVDETPTQSSAPHDERWLAALLPIVDAVDRLSRAASVMSAQRPQPRRFWPFSRKESRDPELLVIEDGLRVLKAQLGDTLRDLGVTRIEPKDEPFDAERHRAVEQRESEDTRAGRVMEVVRPGYRLSDRLIREADVVVGVKRLS